MICVCVWGGGGMCVCVCARVCVRVYVCLYGAVVCAVDFHIAVSIPAEYGFTRLSSPSLSLSGYQQPNVYA